MHCSNVDRLAERAVEERADEHRSSSSNCCMSSEDSLACLDDWQSEACLSEDGALSCDTAVMTPENSADCLPWLFFAAAPLTPTRGHSDVQSAEEDVEHDRTLHEQELDSLPGTAYVQQLYSSDMPATVRSSVVDWLVDATLRLQLPTDALFLAVQLLDRCMAAQQPKLGGFSHANRGLHLTAVAALWVAAKFEEAAVPTAAAFLQLLPGTTNGQLLAAEAALLTALEHRIAKPTPKTFLRHYLCRIALDHKLYFMCSYLAELALLDGGLLCFLPSIVAASAYVWALALTGRACSDQHLTQLTGCRLAQILPCLLRLARVHSAACNTAQPCIISAKYLARSVEQVAAVPPLSSQEVSQLAAQQQQQQQKEQPGNPEQQRAAATKDAVLVVC